MAERKKSAPDREPCPPGHKEVFCRYITKGGKRIYPRNKEFFRFFVKEKKDS